MAAWGAFSFGVVLGWFLYFTNRFRKGDIGLGDLATLLGVIGGGAVTALFGDAKTELFGAYGGGLAFGFFAYFVTLLILVKNSDGAFKATWFLDGRRRDPEAGETIPSEARPTIQAMEMREMADMVEAAPSVLPAVVEQRDRAVAATADALRELMKRIGDTTDDGERARLREAQLQLTGRFDELVALRLKEVLDSEAVRAALAKLGSITDELVSTAREMKAAADALATAARTIDRVSRLIGFLGGAFA